MRIPIIAVIALSLTWQGIARGQTPDLAERVAADISKVLPGATVNVPDPNDLMITYAGQTRGVAIGSVHTACAQGGASCEAAIHSYAQRAASFMLETVPISKDQLRIAVRSRGYLEAMRAQMGSSDTFVFEPLVGDLLSVCFRDLPQGRRPIGTSELATLRLDQPAALSACKSNSRASVRPLASLWKQLPPKSIGVVRTGDDVTGYLTTPEDWRPLAAQVPDLIVSAPTVDTVLYARGSNELEIDALAVITAQMFAQAAVPVSKQVFRWSERGWVAIQR